MSDRILLIDDDPTVTQVISILLKTHGFQVQISDSGQESINMVRESPPAAIILDLMMPGMDGWQVCRNVREFSKVPILVLSAVSDAKLVSEAHRAGADAYFVKPTPSDEIVSSLRKLIRKSKGNL